MKYLIGLTAALLTACATDKGAQLPKYDASEPQLKRVSAFKDDILYTYRIDSRGDGFSKAAADADRWCGQQGMMVTARTNPTCKTAEYADNVQATHCAVSFKCQ